MPDPLIGLIPDDGSWLLIDTNDGWTFQAGASRLVPSLVGVEAERMLDDESVCELIAYADRAGVPLSLPEAAGTPLHELDGVFWLIGGDTATSSRVSLRRCS